MGGIEALVPLLDDPCMLCREKAAGSLRNLAFKSPPNQMRILNAGAIPYLVSLLTSSSEMAVENAASALANVSFDSNIARYV